MAEDNAFSYNVLKDLYQSAERLQGEFLDAAKSGNTDGLEEGCKTVVRDMIRQGSGATNPAFFEGLLTRRGFFGKLEQAVGILKQNPGLPMRTRNDLLNGVYDGINQDIVLGYAAKLPVDLGDLSEEQKGELYAQRNLERIAKELAEAAGTPAPAE